MFNIFNIIISLGALQGFIIGTWLLIKDTKSKQIKFYYAAILIGFAAILLKVTIIDINGSLLLPLLHLNFIYLIAPSLYFYIKGLSKQSAIIPLYLNLHLLPFLLINVGYFSFYIAFHNLVNYQEYLQTIITIDEGVSIFYFAFYMNLTFRHLKKNVAFFIPNKHPWIKKLLLIHLAFLIIWCVYALAEWSYFHYRMEVTAYYPLMIFLSIMLYYLSFQVFTNKDVLFETETIPKRKIEVLDPKKSTNLLNQLNDLMTKEKPFLNGDLSLVSLAASLNVNPKVLSYVINEHMHKNFNDYINDWRIEEVKMRLNDKAYSRLKMISIAFDCGFNSKSTFNLAFKKATGLSPSGYKKD